MNRKARNGVEKKKPVKRPEELSPIPTAAPSEEPQVDEVLDEDESKRDETRRRDPR